MTADPTRITLAPARDDDPMTARIHGYTAHGNHKIDVPFITQVAKGLFHGGVEDGLILPKNIKNVVSLYPWESYKVQHDIDSSVSVRMHDSTDQKLGQIRLLAEWVNEQRKTGDVLVHCQAGLNRSSLVVAAALGLDNPALTGEQIVNIIRGNRTEACLCNSVFEVWVLQKGWEA